MVSIGAPLRVGVIGANVDYGWGGRAHLPALKKLPEYSLTAVCTTRPETAAATADPTAGGASSYAAAADVAAGRKRNEQCFAFYDALSTAQL